MNPKDEAEKVSDFAAACLAFDALKRITERKDMTREFPGLLETLEALEEEILVKADWDSTSDRETGASDNLVSQTSSASPASSSGPSMHFRASMGGVVYSSAGWGEAHPAKGAGPSFEDLKAKLDKLNRDNRKRLY